MLFGIPTALISGAFSAILGFLTKSSSIRAETLAAERKYNMDALVAVSKVNKMAVQDEIALIEANTKHHRAVAKNDPHASMTRRILAYGMMIGLVFVLPAAVIYGDLQWFQINEFTQSSSGFFGIGGYSRQVFETVVVNGLPLAWLGAMTEVFAAIIGYYFGTSAAKYKNPYIGK